MIDKKKAYMYLGDDASFSEKLYLFKDHNTKMSVVLDEILEKSNQKIASRNLKRMLCDAENIIEEDCMIRWRKKEVWRIKKILDDRYDLKDSNIAFDMFNNIQQKFDVKINLKEIKESILNNSDDVKTSFKISKMYWGNIENHEFFKEMVLRVAKIFVHVSSVELSFLFNYIQVDEHGVLFLFQKVIYACLKCKLASQLIVALYKPGAFIMFFSKVLDILSKNRSILSLKGIMTVKATTAIKVVSVTGLTLSVTLYSGILARKDTMRLDRVSLYDGLSGHPGNYIGMIRSLGSKLIFELTKTLSTWSNAAVAGALEPKQEFVRNVLENIADRRR